MKSLVTLFLFAYMSFSSPNTVFTPQIKTNELLSLQSFGAIILDNGIADLTVNPDGASAVLQSGKLWVSGIDEKVEVFCNEAIMTIDGVALIEADDESSRVRVIDGFVRIVETGGFPGETVSIGYERKLYRNGKHAPRKLYSEDLRSEFCGSHAQNELFGCAGGNRDQIFSATASDGEVPAVTIVIHPFTQVSSESYESFPEIILAQIKRKAPSAEVLLLDKVSYRTQWEYSSDKEGNYIVLDWSVPKSSSGQNQSVLVSFYDSKTRNLSKRPLKTSATGGKTESMDAIASEIAHLLEEFLKGR